jgi:apolipoprotein N-acyltransferase
MSLFIMIDPGFGSEKRIVAKLSKQIDKIPFAPVVAIAFGVVSAALVFAVPDWRFSQGVTASGLPEILSAARPPLGDTARALVAIAVGMAVCTVLWIGLSVLGGFSKRASRNG